MAADLAQSFTVIRPDYTGSGATEDDGRPLSVAYFAKQVMAAVADAGVTEFAVVGFSLGAAIATQIAADHPDRLRQLTLIAGFAAPDPRLTMQFTLWRDLIATDPAAMARLVLLTGFSPEALSAWGTEGVAQALRDTLATQNWTGMARQIAVDLSLDVREAVARIRTPTLGDRLSSRSHGATGPFQGPCRRDPERPLCRTAHWPSGADGAARACGP